MMQPAPAFDPDGVLASVSALAGSVAEIVVRDGGRRIWIFPMSGESPVYICLPVEEPDSCDVHTGFAFSTTLLAQAEGDRGAAVSELIVEIAAGRATEFFDFGDTDGVVRSPGRDFGSSGMHWNRQWTDNPPTHRAYTVPAWMHQPIAPDQKS